MKLIEITTTDRQALRALLDRPLTELMGSLSVDTINDLSGLYHRIDSCLNVKAEIEWLSPVPADETRVG